MSLPAAVPYIRISTIGDWRREMRKMRMLAPDIHRAALRGQERAAKKLVKIVKDHLTNQDLQWTSLSKSTLRKKGGDTRMLLSSETYFNNIKAFRKGYVYYAGVKRGVTEPNGIETARVAAIHEFRSLAVKGSPRRPLWTPSIAEMGGAKGIRNIVVKAIARKLALRGWTLTKFLGLRI